jgi:hypothetical protein
MTVKKQVLARSIMGEVHIQKGWEAEISSLLTHIIPIQILNPFLKLDLLKRLRDLVYGYLHLRAPPFEIRDLVFRIFHLMSS